MKLLIAFSALATEAVSSFIHLFLIGLTAEKLSKIINKNLFCLIFIQILFNFSVRSTDHIASITMMTLPQCQQLIFIELTLNQNSVI